MQSSRKASPASLRHLPLLDGWRALSIALVLAGHLLPLGPGSWGLNAPVAATGMVIFFTLSGFLITRFLIEDGDIRRFLVRRLLRIVPLAWLGMLLAFAVSGDISIDQIIGNLLFAANLPPSTLIPPGAHFWSLCIEVQFYLTIALLVAIGGRRSLLLIPTICITITLARIYWQQPMSIATWFRIDEILAGAVLALIYEGWLGERLRRLIAMPSPFLIFPLLLASADLRTGFLPYLRPYLSALMVGASLYNARPWLRELCQQRVVIYVAQTSYALYVFHGIFANSWLGSGDTLIKYLKRPLLIAATIGCAHLSTFHYERRWISLGRRLAPHPLKAPLEAAVAPDAIRVRPVTLDSDLRPSSSAERP
ncbi:acyltransferase family protein [Sphingopyxis chilensis]